LTSQASDALVERFQEELAELGLYPWAVELVELSTFVGFVGLHSVPVEMTVAPAVELGWRLARSA
jgi:hypothetical protein